MSRHLTLFSALLAICITARAADLSKHMPATSPVLQGYNDIDSVKLAIDMRGPDDIEGIWKMAGTQTTVVIEPATTPTLSGAGFEAYQIVIVSSPRKSMRPGTVLGYIVPTARKNYYEARIYTSKTRAILQKHRRFTLNLTDDRHMSMTANKAPWRINLRHTLRFLVRAGISTQSTDDMGLDGFIKQYPAPEGVPDKPVYL